MAEDAGQSAAGRGGQRHRLKWLGQAICFREDRISWAGSVRQNHAIIYQLQEAAKVEVV